MDGISRREAARRAGIDESTVRKAINAGALDRALLPNGSLHPELVLKLLAENVQRGKVAPSNLTTAKTRRLRAQVEKLSDEVAELRGNAIGIDAMEEWRGEESAFIKKHFASMPWDAGTMVAGKPAATAHLVLRGLVFGALTRVSETDPEPVEESDGNATEPEVDLSTLSPNDLAARRLSLQAEKLEIETALARGEMRLVPDIIAEFEERLGVAKSLLMAMPGRLANEAEVSTPEAFETLVADELEGALAEI